MDIMDSEGDYTTDFLALMEYIKHFNVHYRLLLCRYSRFKKINDISNRDIDVITYLDMIVVHLRALCIENERLKKNYTAQVLLRKVGEEVLANKIDAMLDEEFFSYRSNFSIRKAIKTLADCFICHYDNFDGDEENLWEMAGIIEKQLRNPYDKHNLDYIMDTVIKCIESGLLVTLNITKE